MVETPNVKSQTAVASTRLLTLALAASLAGCSSLGNLFSSDKPEAEAREARPKQLEIPPDLTQLARESRYQVQGGVVSASTAGAAGTPGRALPATSAAAVALNVQGEVRIERVGQQRWLAAPIPPDALWPRVKAFWEQRGYTLATEDAAAGVMETNWYENRIKPPGEGVRGLFGRLVGALYDTGERDRFRTRIERVSGGSEVYIAHRGAAEVYTTETRDSTTWRPRPTDPQLEAEMLQQLLLALTATVEAATPQKKAPAGAPAAAVAAGTQAPARARLTSGPAAVEVDEPFDRAWRRVGLALDRGGFTVEDRDRAAGVYYVRYIDPKSAGKDEPGWWSKLWGDGTNPQAAVRYRLQVKATGEKTLVSVLTSAGVEDGGENAKAIAAQLVSELR